MENKKESSAMELIGKIILYTILGVLYVSFSFITIPITIGWVIFKLCTGGFGKNG